MVTHSGCEQPSWGILEPIYRELNGSPFPGSPLEIFWKIFLSFIFSATPLPHSWRWRKNGKRALIGGVGEGLDSRGRALRGDRFVMGGCQDCHSRGDRFVIHNNTVNNKYIKSSNSK